MFSNLSLIGSLDYFLEGGRLHYFHSVSINNRVESLQELSNFLLFGVEQLWGIPRQSLKLSEILEDCHVPLLELLKFYNFLPLDVRWHILLTELIFE